MTTPSSMPSQAAPLSPAFLDFIAAFMRALNTARLYASGHELFKKNVQALYEKLQKVMAERDFLFIGCARETIFLEGTFYQAKDAHLKNFLKFFHALGISHILLDVKSTTEELDSLVSLLAGARQGQGEEVSAALPHENVRHIQLGLLDYSIFSTIQAVAGQLAQNTEDETLWRQLILQPAARATLHLTPEKMKQLARLSDDVEELKRLLLQMDSQMTEKQQGISASQRGLVLGNFIQNLANTLAGVDPNKRKPFAEQVGLILTSLEPSLKTQILGSAPPDPVAGDEGGVIHEILQAIPDDQLVYLLIDALKEGGSSSPCFSNLFRRAVAKYREPGLLLALIRKEMQRATQERRPGILSQWQQLEQILMREQETKALNEQYHREIEALATSIQMKRPLVEEEEMSRLMGTLSPESLTKEKARLIIDIVRHPHATLSKALLPSLLGGLGVTLKHLHGEMDFQGVGILLRELFLGLTEHPQESLARKDINALFNTEEIRELLKNLLTKVRTYESQETATLDAICQLYPDKAGSFFVDILLDLKDEGTPQGKWIYSTLAGLGPVMSRLVSRRLQGAQESHILKLLTLATFSGDRQLGFIVEELLEHQSHDIRLRALSTLGELHAERSVPRLKEILLQKSWLKTKKVKDLQMVAARALAAMGTEEARAVLQEIAADGSGDLQALCRELL